MMSALVDAVTPEYFGAAHGDTPLASLNSQPAHIMWTKVTPRRHDNANVASPIASAADWSRAAPAAAQLHAPRYAESPRTDGDLRHRTRTDVLGGGATSGRSTSAADGSQSVQVTTVPERGAGGVPAHWQQPLHHASSAGVTRSNVFVQNVAIPTGPARSETRIISGQRPVSAAPIFHKSSTMRGAALPPRPPPPASVAATPQMVADATSGPTWHPVPFRPAGILTRSPGGSPGPRSSSPQSPGRAGELAGGGVLGPPGQQQAAQGPAGERLRMLEKECVGLRNRHNHQKALLRRGLEDLEAAQRAAIEEAARAVGWETCCQMLRARGVAAARQEVASRRAVVPQPTAIPAMAADTPRGHIRLATLPHSVPDVLTSVGGVGAEGTTSTAGASALAAESMLEAGTAIEQLSAVLRVEAEELRRLKGDLQHKDMMREQCIEEERLEWSHERAALQQKIHGLLDAIRQQRAASRTTPVTAPPTQSPSMEPRSNRT